MANSKKTLPSLDYVSIVSSLYKDRRAMLVGTLASVLGALAAAFRADSILLVFHAVLLVALLVSRDYNMRAFAKASIDPADVVTAERWERRALFFGYFAAIAYGSWVFSSIVFVRDSFAELVSVSVTIAAMVGIVTRNYGHDRLMAVQILGMGGLMVLGLVLKGDIFHVLLASLFLPMLFSFRALGADVRNNLLDAVHDRVAASRLASQLDTALETMQHGLCMLDGNGVIALANDRAHQMFAGIADGSWMGRTFSDLIDEAIMKRALDRETADRLNRMIATQTGGKVIMKLSGDFHCEVSVSSREDRTVLLLENVTERIRAQERINFMARYDGLTGLPNRAYFTEQVAADLAAREPGAQPVLMAIVDLDDFKHINDTMGHLAGDRVLSMTAARIKSVMHPQSRIGRFGGDEFILYRSQEIETISVEEEMDAILAAASKPVSVNGEKIDLHASLGYVIYDAQQMRLDDLVSRADLALYTAKAQGKGRHQIFEEAMDEQFRYRQRLKSDLAEAIENNQMRVVYQPLVDLKTRRIAGCEALTRWTHPELGPIRPDIFIALAEEVGLVSSITDFVLRTATAECANWPEGISVAVNVSARDLRGENLAASISCALAQSGLTPQRLEIEVTETALIEERINAAARLADLARQGIGIALDDFGTGYSSLSYLREMPFTKLKIDRAFIAGITTDPRSLRLMANVARLGKDLDLVLTAEGIETEDQLTVIASQTEVDQVQGFLFGMPLPGAEIRELIAQMNREPSGKTPVLSARRQ